MSDEFEDAVRLSGGWVDLTLPTEEEAARYFASFRRAPPDNSALVPGPQVQLLHAMFTSCLPIFELACSILCLLMNATLPNLIFLKCCTKCNICDMVQVAITDEDIVRALVQEVVQVMNGPLFITALKVRAQDTPWLQLDTLNIFIMRLRISISLGNGVTASDLHRLLALYVHLYYNERYGARSCRLQLERW
jgi:hypothetical protein